MIPVAILFGAGKCVSQNRSGDDYHAMHVSQHDGKDSSLAPDLLF